MRNLQPQIYKKTHILKVSNYVHVTTAIRKSAVNLKDQNNCANNMYIFFFNVSISILHTLSNNT